MQQLLTFVLFSAWLGDPVDHPGNRDLRLARAGRACRPTRAWLPRERTHPVEDQPLPSGKRHAVLDSADVRARPVTSIAQASRERPAVFARTGFAR